MQNKGDKLKDDIYIKPEEEITQEKFKPESTEISLELKKEKKKKEHKVEIVSKLYVWYSTGDEQMTRTPNIWGEIRIGETIYL